jgi:GTP-binding protein
MQFHTEFLLSAMSAPQFPSSARTGDAPEIAFLGRSNVGKSSLLNKLVGAAAAKVSSTPGRTRAINFFALHEGTAVKHKASPALLFADLPGYGYAKISKSISAEWPKFIEPYLADREQLALCLCLVDSNIPPQESDAQLLHYLRETGRPHLVVATKADRLSNNTLAKSLAALKKAHNEDRILPVSSKSENGVKALWPEIQTVLN